jgi:hypothetical protein
VQGLFHLQHSCEGSQLSSGIFVGRQLGDLVCGPLLLHRVPHPPLFCHELQTTILQGRRPEGEIDDGVVDGLILPFENVFPHPLEGLEEDTLRHGGGTKRIFIGVLVLPAPYSSSLLVAGRGGYISRAAS